MIRDIMLVTINAAYYYYRFNYFIASRIPAARPEGALFAVPGFLSLCVRKLHYPAEEEDDECLSILPDRMTVCLSIWEDLVKKGVYQNWYHTAPGGVDLAHHNPPGSAPFALARAKVHRGGIELCQG